MIRSITKQNGIFFTIFGDAIPSARGRTVTNRYTGMIHTFIPKTTVEWKNSIIRQSILYHPNSASKANISMGMLFYKKIPKSYSKKKRIAIDSGILRPTSSDLDNLIKSVKDALNKIFYYDDSQIVEYPFVNGLPTGKYFSEIPRVEIMIRYLPSFINSSKK